MPQGEPKCGEKYRHFKDKLYQIVTVAKHSETGEQLVIYQALYDDFGVYARPFSMFVSEVDHVKYPQVEQRYRFELVEEGEKLEQKTLQPEKSAENSQREENGISGPEHKQTGTWGTPAATAETCCPEGRKKTMEDLLMDFYDAQTYGDKYEILTDMREGITDMMINNMAVVLDLVIQEGPIEQRYEELRRCLRTRRQYETSRF